MNEKLIQLRRGKWDADQFWDEIFKASNDLDITQVEICKNEKG